MAKRPRILIAEILEDLEEGQLEKFRDQMREPRNDNITPNKFRRAQLQGKKQQQLADLLVDSLAQHAVPVTVGLLKAIGCNNAAKDLEEEAKEAPAAKSSGEASAAAAQTEHFVDRHRNELITRVSNMPPILDHLLLKKVLQQEQYDIIMEISTSQARMRFLFSGPLKSGGNRAKDVLLSALEKEEQYLIEELREKEA